MGLEKAIKYGKEKRKKYRGVKSWDKWCRNHGVYSIPKANKDRKMAKAPKIEEGE